MDTLEKNEMMFIQLVSMFQAAALQQMGKMKNPVTGKIERNIEQAQLSIDDRYAEGKDERESLVR